LFPLKVFAFQFAYPLVLVIVHVPRIGPLVHHRQGWWTMDGVRMGIGASDGMLQRMCMLGAAWTASRWGQDVAPP